jgi:SAM-dependent methyltransferase
VTKRADVYGRYSRGSGAILKDPDRVWDILADPDVLAGYEKSMRLDMAKSGIPLADLADWQVMDVGTGRQALTFVKFGAKRVSHFDISPENVARMNDHIATSALQDRLDTTCCDLVETDLGNERFDLVYLNGIVQHFSDVGRGLLNCIRALKRGGYLWLYFYRSGTFDNFVLYMLRDLVHGGNVVVDDAMMREYYVASCVFFSKTVAPNYLSSMFMDGVFTRFARLYTPATYLTFTERCGFEVVSSSGLDPVGRDTDHVFARAATVLTLRKDRDVSVEVLNEAARLLAPSAEVNQLDPGHYHDPEIIRSIALCQKLKSLLAGRNIAAAQTMFVVMRIFALLARTIRAEGFDATQRHPVLQQMVESCIELIEREYGVSDHLSGVNA